MKTTATQNIPESTLSKKTVRTVVKAVCTDSPRKTSPLTIESNNFILRVPSDKYAGIAASFCVPEDATVSEGDGVTTATWPSYGDTYLGPDGVLAQRLDGYEHRLPQIHMARMLQRSIEMGDVAMLEAATGVGKSFVYTIIGLAMGKCMVIVCPTIALQDQLWSKDLPFLLSLPEFAEKRAALSLGRGNYVCNYKAVDPLSGAYAVPDKQFVEWYESTESGRFEEIPLTLTGEQKGKLAVGDDCLRKSCPLYLECFHKGAMDKMRTADVILTNSAIWAINKNNPWAALLPENYDFLVVDEAHMLPDSVQSQLGESIKRKGIDQALQRSQKYNLEYDADIELASFVSEIDAFLTGKNDDRIGVEPQREFLTGLRLAKKLRELANCIFPAEAVPQDAEQAKRNADATRLRNAADAIRAFSMTTGERNVRYIETGGPSLEFVDAPFDCSAFIARAFGRTPRQFRVDHTKCSKCNRTLTAENVFTLHGRPFGPKCINDVDVTGEAEQHDLDEWLNGQHEDCDIEEDAPAVLLTSATLTSPFPQYSKSGQWPKWIDRSFRMFNRECGLDDDDVFQITLDSPFDYENRALLYIANGPEPRDWENWKPHVEDEIEKLVGLTGGGAFLLFTSRRALENTWNALQPLFAADGLLCIKQGDLSKTETIAQFKADGNAILFGLKSYWQGIDIQGDALRLVCIDKIPLQVPNDPVIKAQNAALETIARDYLELKGQGVKFYGFNAQSVPKASMNLRQGGGRLLRTKEDRGIIAILDGRLMSKSYAKNGIFPSLPAATTTRRFDQLEALYEELMRDEESDTKVII